MRKVVFTLGRRRSFFVVPLESREFWTIIETTTRSWMVLKKNFYTKVLLSIQMSNIQFMNVFEHKYLNDLNLFIYCM